MSTVTYRYEKTHSYKKKGVKYVVKESVIDGEKGLSFHFLTKEGDKKFYRISVRETEKDKFTVKEKKDDKETEKKNVSIADIIKMLKANKYLAFVLAYVTNERGKYG